MIKKKFDCVEMKREAQEIIRKELENLDKNQQLEYWKKKHLELLCKFDIKAAITQ